jgi:hypothetical protein
MALNKQQILSVIAGIRVRQLDVNESIQTVLVNSTFHAIQHSDVSTFEALLYSTKGADRKAIMAWCKEFAPVNFNKDGKPSLNKSKFQELKTGETTFEQVSDYEHWTTYVPSVAQIAQSFDLLSRAESIIKKSDEHDASVKILNGDFASYLKDAVAKFKAAQSEVVNA